MLQAKSQLTLQEFLNLPQEEGDITYELIDAQAVPKVSPKFFHSKGCELEKCGKSSKGLPRPGF